MSDISPLYVGLPFRQEGSAGLSDATVTTLSAQNAKIASTCTSRLVASLGSETITKVGFRQGTTTGTPASNSYRIGIQGISNTSGDPDGTYLNSNAYADFTPSSGNDGKWVWVTLANSASINRGQLISLVLERTAATDASNCISAWSSHQRHTGRPGFPQAHTHNGTSWTKSTTAVGCLGYGSANNIYLFAAQTIIKTNAFGNTTEVGMTFTVPTTYCSTYQLLGIRWFGLAGSTGSKTFIATLYSNPVSGSIAVISQSNQCDEDLDSANNSSDRPYELMFADSTLPTLNAGTKYGVGIACTTASDRNLMGLEVTSASDATAWSHSDFGIAYTSRTLTDYPPSGNDTNNFAAETTTQWPYIELIIGSMTQAGGSSGMIRSGMEGGIRG